MPEREICYAIITKNCLIMTAHLARAGTCVTHLPPPPYSNTPLSHHYSHHSSQCKNSHIHAGVTHLLIIAYSIT